MSVNRFGKRKRRDVVEDNTGATRRKPGVKPSRKPHKKMTYPLDISIIELIEELAQLMTTENGGGDAVKKYEVVQESIKHFAVHKGIRK